VGILKKCSKTGIRVRFITLDAKALSAAQKKRDITQLNSAFLGRSVISIRIFIKERKAADFNRSILFCAPFIKKAADIPVTKENMKSGTVVPENKNNDNDMIITLITLS